MRRFWRRDLLGRGISPIASPWAAFRWGTRANLFSDSSELLGDPVAQFPWTWPVVQEPGGLRLTAGHND